jgi:hypothetical protein
MLLIRLVIVVAVDIAADMTVRTLVAAPSVVIKSIANSYPAVVFALSSSWRGKHEEVVGRGKLSIKDMLKEHRKYKRKEVQRGRLRREGQGISDKSNEPGRLLDEKMLHR